MYKPSTLQYKLLDLQLFYQHLSIFMSNKVSYLADQTIDSHVLWSMGAGAIPLPILDIVAVSAIQLNMYKELCMLYQSDYNEAFAKNMISSIAGATIAKIGASLLKSIPVIGSFLGSMPMVVLSGTSTYAMGQVFKKYLEIGEAVSAFSFDNAKKIYENAFEKGKSYVEDMRKQANSAMGFKEEEKKSETKENTNKNPSQQESENVIEKLQTLASLKEKGLLTEEEFQEKRKKLLEEL
ncbi:MAG: DUF697 domain-containing protein [Cytophagia bacterium]|nr:MAG: DUF697 domain-containing protein [Cytophagia bacterium]TAG40729.1 MAG: DUF697 domain-containing protein [Cytophagia bacterium]